MEAVTEHDSSFRTRQAVADLVHHAGPLAKLHFSDLAQASGLTPRAAGDALALLRDDGFCFHRDETLALMGGLEALAIAGKQGFDLATVILLADVLQTRRGSGLQIWGKAAQQLQDWPTTLRAAMANGLMRAVELGLVTSDTMPGVAARLTRPAEIIAEALLQIARSMRPDELLAVAQGDCGREVERHLTALRQAISLRDGTLLPEESWYPGEVVELAAHVPDQPGHPGCTAILLLNALQPGGSKEGLALCWLSQAAAYCDLKPSQRDPILAAFRYLYETDAAFLDGKSHLTIPVVAEV